MKKENEIWMWSILLALSIVPYLLGFFIIDAITNGSFDMSGFFALVVVTYLGSLVVVWLLRKYKHWKWVE